MNYIFYLFFFQIDESPTNWGYRSKFQATFSVSGKEMNREHKLFIVFLNFSVRWIGEIEDMSMIGLESLNLTLPGNEQMFQKNSTMNFRCFRI